MQTAISRDAKTFSTFSTSSSTNFSRKIFSLFSWIQYYLIDVVALYMGIIYLIYYLLKRLLSRPEVIHHSIRHAHHKVKKLN